MTTFLIILACYALGTLITARIIGNEIYKEDGERATYGFTALALIWPVLAVVFGWEWWATGAERKDLRQARKAEKQRKADIVAREKRNQERDDAMRPWNLILRDPEASEEQKAFAQDVLRGLALK